MLTLFPKNVCFHFIHIVGIYIMKESLHKIVMFSNEIWLVVTQMRATSLN